jgi:hypothetical protein
MKVISMRDWCAKTLANKYNLFLNVPAYNLQNEIRVLIRAYNYQRKEAQGGAQRNELRSSKR